MQQVKKTSSDTITFSLPRFSTINFPVVILLLFVFAAGLTIGSLYTKVQYLEKGGTTAVAGATDTTQAQQPAAAQPTVAPVTRDQIKALFTNKNIVFGDTNSKNLIVEVADPSCPFCHVAAGHNPELNAQMGANFKLSTDGGTYTAPVPEIKKLVDSGKAAFVFLYTPGHGNGELGTKAMYCAYENDTFWQVHDKLMTNEGYTMLNDEVKNDVGKAQQLADFLADATDPAALVACLESDKYAKQLSDDVAKATSIGIQATPGFYINTKLFSGAYSWDDMKSSIQ